MYDRYLIMQSDLSLRNIYDEIIFNTANFIYLFKLHVCQFSDKFRLY